ncbi:MAG: fatty acyl-AMP ligase [Frankiaceae bacterium]
MPQRALLPEILASRAAAQRDQRAYAFLDERGQEVAALTYGELHARALAVARQLSERCRPGDRALLLFPPGLDFIVAWFGCLYAQVIAVPVNPPRRDRLHDATRSVVRDCEPAAALTIAAMAEPARAALDAVRAGLHWLAVDRLDVAAGAGFQPRPCSPDAVAFLQYTSGSTSDPKGVMVSHRNLAANEEMIQRGFGHDERSTFVGWTPLFHDQGLIGNVLQPLHLGALSVLMSPLAFIRWPLLWPAAISRYRAHTSGGPNFAFDICAAKVAKGGLPDDTDLSCWKVAYNGAEPIRPETLRRFAAALAPYGFSERALYPCYGLAEATLLVTGSEKGRGPRTLDADVAALGRRELEAPAGRGTTLVGSGLVLPEERVRIVDPETRRPCAGDRIGEIWVSGEHVTQGYWQRPEATAETFHARLDDEPGRTYLRTGDLGALVDGELYVVGRLKDLVIIRGRNYYPHDIERTAQTAHPMLRPGGCAAFSVGDDGERLVVVQEVRREPGSSGDSVDLADVAGSIREAVAREHEVSLSDLVLTVPGALQKTSSGKIMRAAARRRYLDGGFEEWTPVPAEELEGVASA